VIYNVTGGEEKYASIIVENTTGQDISGDTFQIGLSTTQTSAPDWQDPSLTETITTSKMRVALLITDQGPGIYYAWVRIVDGEQKIFGIALNDVIEVL